MECGIFKYILTLINVLQKAAQNQASTTRACIINWLQIRIRLKCARLKCWAFGATLLIFIRRSRDLSLIPAANRYNASVGLGVPGRARTDGHNEDSIAKTRIACQTRLASTQRRVSRFQLVSSKRCMHFRAIKRASRTGPNLQEPCRQTRRNV